MTPQQNEIDSALDKVFDAMFEDEGWEGFAAALEELDIEATPESCRKAFDTLPTSIKLDMVTAGLGDTVCRDSAYVFLRDNNYRG